MLNFLIEFLPLAGFFIGYKIGGIIQATIYMLVLTIISVIVGYYNEGKVNKINLISAALLLISGSMTIASGNPAFIKMKPTILYIIFSIIFLISGIYQKPAIRYLFRATIEFSSDNSWYILNKRFMYFFLLMAALNEYIWRNFSEAFWVKMKVFGFLPISLLFVILQIPFIIKHKKPD